MPVVPLALQPSDANYYDQARPELVQVAVQHGVSGRVLDVGCSRGWLGRELLTRGIASEVHGVEIDPAAAVIAGSRLTSVRNANLEDPGALDDLGGDFDAMIFADVLEHLTQPEVVLARGLRRLRPGGVVIVSLPNVRHHAVVRGLVIGNSWQYTEAGVLDRTHLRFFTSTTARSLCEEQGLTVHAVYAGVGPKARRVLRLAPPLLTFAAAQLVLATSKAV